MYYAYPVIYTRTLKCDYFSNFHVLPPFVNGSWLLQYIRSATTDMNPTEQQNKKIIVSNGRYCIFGTIGYTKAITTGLDAYCRDEKGRGIFGFYGFVVQVNKTASTIPVFSEDDISEIHKKYIVPVWNETVSHTQSIAAAVELKEENISGNTEIDSPELTFNNSMNLFLTDFTLYKRLLYKAITGNTVTYCSDINDFKALKQSPFEYVITSYSNISRLREEEEKRRREEEERRRQEEEKRRREEEERRRQEEERRRREEEERRRQEEERCRQEEERRRQEEEKRRREEEERRRRQAKSSSVSSNYPPSNSNLGGSKKNGDMEEDFPYSAFHKCNNCDNSDTEKGLASILKGGLKEITNNAVIIGLTISIAMLICKILTQILESGKDENKISEISNKINEATHTFEKQEGDEGTDAK